MLKCFLFVTATGIAIAILKWTTVGDKGIAVRIDASVAQEVEEEKI